MRPYGATYPPAYPAQIGPPSSAYRAAPQHSSAPTHSDLASPLSLAYSQAKQLLHCLLATATTALHWTVWSGSKPPHVPKATACTSRSRMRPTDSLTRCSRCNHPNPTTTAPQWATQPRQPHRQHRQPPQHASSSNPSTGHRMPPQTQQDPRRMAGVPVSNGRCVSALCLHYLREEVGESVDVDKVRAIVATEDAVSVILFHTLRQIQRPHAPECQRTILG